MRLLTAVSSVRVCQGQPLVWVYKYFAYRPIFFCDLKNFQVGYLFNSDEIRIFYDIINLPTIFTKEAHIWKILLVVF